MTKFHGRGCDCDDCTAVRAHAKHKHCLECRICLDDTNTSTTDGDHCRECVPCGIGCEVHEECVARDVACGDDDCGDEFGDGGLGLPVTVEGVRRFG